MACHCAILLVLLTQSVYAEPLPLQFLRNAPPYTNLAARAENWTTQAWQTQCNNIDYFGDNDQCCIHLSGPNWKSCNGVGWATSYDSGVLCYDLTDSHDCCNDDSVCDMGLGCCSGTCCQTSTSTTVCKDGCVAINGKGCRAGTCAHGTDLSTTISSKTSTLSGTTSQSTGSPGSSTGSTSSSASDSGGSSRSDKIAIGCGIGIGLPATLATLWMCMRRR